MTKNTFTIGRLFGIPIKVHVSWFLIFILVTWSLAASYFPPRYPGWSPALYWGVGLATSIAFFLSVLMHELAHSLMAEWNGLPIHDIVLFIFGGVSQLTEEPEAPHTEFTMALVGPLTSFALAIFFGVVWFLTRGSNSPIAAFSTYLAYINLSLGAFNLIPGFPLDGGRVLRSVLWAMSNNLERATRWATIAGQVIAYMFIFFGAWQILRGRLGDGLWIAFVGWFLDNAAQTSYRQVAIRYLLADHRVREAMTQACYPVSPYITLETLVNNYIVSGQRCFPVMRDDRLVGIVSLSRIRNVPRETWPQVTISAVMVPLEEMPQVRPDDGLWAALEKMTTQQVDQLPVVKEGELVGMLLHENILSFIRQRGVMRE